MKGNSPVEWLPFIFRITGALHQTKIKSASVKTLTEALFLC